MVEEGIIKWLVLANVNKPRLQRLQSPGLMGKSKAKSLGGSSVADSLRPHTIGTELLVNFIEKKDIITDGSKLWVSWHLYILITRDIIILIAEKYSLS